ncbi:non-specific serine/threonine protein kinase [Plasmodiophora brassicae]
MKASPGEADAGPGASSSDLDRSRSHLHRVQTELATVTEYAKGQQRNYECLSTAYHRLQLELDAARKSLADVSDVQVASEADATERKQLEQRVEQLEKDKTDLNKQLREAKAAYDAIAQRQRGADDRMAQMETATQALEIQIVKLRESDDRYRALLKQAQQKSREDRQAVANSDQKVALAMRQLADRDATIGGLEERVKAADIARCKAENALYRSALDRDALTMEVARVRDECTRLDNDLRESQSKLSHLETARSDMEMNLKEARSRIKTLEGSPDALQRQLDEAVRARQAADERVDELTATIGELRDRADDLLGQLARSRSDLSELSHDLDEARERNAHLDENMVRLTSAHEDAQREADRVADMERRVQEVERENDDLREMVDEIERQRAAWTKEIRDMLSDSQGQQQLFNEFQQINARLHARQAEARSEIARLVEERDRLRQSALASVSRADQLERDVADARTAMEAMRAAFENDSAQLRAEVDETLASLRRQLSDQKAELADVRQRNRMLLRRETLSPAEVKAIRDREKELNATVSKLVLAEQASEPSFTCFDCVQVFKDPVTCIPCGHSACEQCIVKIGYCSQCGTGKAVTFYPNQLLSELSAKHVYRKQALQGLLQMSAAFLETHSSP